MKSRSLNLYSDDSNPVLLTIVGEIYLLKLKSCSDKEMYKKKILKSAICGQFKVFLVLPTLFTYPLFSFP